METYYFLWKLTIRNLIDVNWIMIEKKKSFFYIFVISEKWSESWINNDQIYNTIVTRHAFLIIFFIVISFLIGGFGNWLIPLILGSPDIAFPRINNIRFWLLPPSLFILLLRNLFYPRPGTGWTVYPPLSAYLYHSSPSVDFAIFSLHISGISSIIESLNLIVTIIIIKNFSLNYDQISLFPWSVFITAILLIQIIPNVTFLLSLFINGKRDRIIKTCNRYI